MDPGVPPAGADGVGAEGEAADAWATVPPEVVADGDG